MKVLTSLCFVLVFALSLPVFSAQKLIINGPQGSGRFGLGVYKLPNGNIVVTDPEFKVAAGSVFLYDGKTLGLISQLDGQFPGNHVGSDGVIILPTGNFLVLSSKWGGQTGAVTWCDKNTGCNGSISPSNSITGNQIGDSIGTKENIIVLANGNWLLRSQYSNRGAVTWGSGTAPVAGNISPQNSLVGSAYGDNIGRTTSIFLLINPLKNGNYVVVSPDWNSNRGAVTFCLGNGTCVGEVTSTNSLVGSSPNDRIGSHGQDEPITELANGNFLVLSTYSPDGLHTGTLTWGSGTTGVTGPVSIANSVSPAGELVTLGTGNYVLPVILNDGSHGFTFCDGTKGCSGAPSPASTLVGVSPHDLDDSSVIATPDGNYLLVCATCSTGNPNVKGAIVYGDGINGTVGPFTNARRIVNVQLEYLSHTQLLLLPNGKFLFVTPYSATHSVTLIDPANPPTGPLDESNSFAALHPFPLKVYVLKNGNYVIANPGYNGDGIINGFVAFGDADRGIVGHPTPQNCLYGTMNQDDVGEEIFPLANGNYVVSSPYWNDSHGAITFGNGRTGVTGPVSSSNSLIGSQFKDYVGFKVLPLPNGDYISEQFEWNNEKGAVTWGNMAPSERQALFRKRIVWLGRNIWTM